MFNMRTACDTAHVKSVLWLLLNMLQHVLANSLQCGVTTCVARKLNWRLLPKTCCSMFRRSQSTDFTCSALQAVRILNICETFHKVHLPLNFLFKFTGINVISVIFTCQMMSNFLKHPVYKLLCYRNCTVCL